MRKFAFGFAGAVFLSGCAGLDLGGTAAPVQSAALLGGAVGIAGPEGYCIDVADSALIRGFAILAPCATLKVSGVNAVSQPAVITVQAGRVGTASVAGSEPAFAGLLETEAGAAVLSQSGSSADVDVIDTSGEANLVKVYFEDSAGPLIPGTQAKEWRAFFDVSGRLVTVSLRGLDAAPIDQNTGETLLDDAVAAILQANPA